MPTIIEDGIEKVVITHTTEEKLEKKQVKEQLDNYKELKRQVNEKWQKELNVVQTEIDSLQNLLTQFKV